MTGRQSRLAHLPIALFAAPMGLGGAGLAWREAALGLGAPALPGETLLALAILVHAALLLLHLGRALRHPAALAADLMHPIRAAFAGAVSIGFMIEATALLPYLPGLAEVLWLIGIAWHLGVGCWLVRRLLQSPGDTVVLSPPLMIPLVGHVIAPIAGVPLGHAALSWALFGIGTMLWLMLQPLILHRVVAGPPMPGPLRPTLGIFLAPPAVAALALLALQHAPGPAVLACYGGAALVAAVLLSLAPGFARLPFAVSWWAWTFPSAAFATATAALARHGVMPAAPAWLALLLCTAILGLVAWRSWRALLAGSLLRAEG
jgi:tellurite resistance protein